MVEPEPAKKYRLRNTVRHPPFSARQAGLNNNTGTVLKNMLNKFSYLCQKCCKLTKIIRIVGTYRYRYLNFKITVPVLLKKNNSQQILTYGELPGAGAF